MGMKPRPSKRDLSEVGDAELFAELVRRRYLFGVKAQKTEHILFSGRDDVVGAYAVYELSAPLGSWYERKARGGR